jgi:hypothetical protein
MQKNNVDSSTLLRQAGSVLVNNKSRFIREMESQRKIFKELQQSVCLQSPETAKTLEMCDKIASIFAHGLESCEHEMSFRAVILKPFPGDSEGLRMDAELDVLCTGVANAIKYDYCDLAEQFDFDYTVEKKDEETELWFHARRKQTEAE